MINPENPMSQNKNGSPAQIMAEPSELATLIFGSNSDAFDYCAKFERINAGIEESGSSQGFECPVPGANARTHTHARTHTQVLQ